MSIVNVVVSPHRVVMLTDSSFYDGNATIIGFDQKAFAVERWNGAISSRGDVWALAAGRALAERYATLDEYVALSAPVIEREYRTACDEARDAGRVSRQTMIEMHVIGWSEQDDRAKAFILYGGLPAGSDRPEFVWRPVHEVDDSDMLIQDVGAREEWRLHRQGAQPHVDFTADTFEPLRHGLLVIEAQRRRPCDPTLGMPAGFHGIGGELWLTVCDQDGTRQDVIHEWPDAVGEPIQPAPFRERDWPLVPPHDWPEADRDIFPQMLERGLVDMERMWPDANAIIAYNKRQAQRQVSAPVAATGMTRQQRRAAEAQARKAKKGRAHAA